MRYVLGEIVKKSMPSQHVMSAIPNTIEYNSLNQVVGTYSSGGPIPTLDTTAEIIYTKRRKKDSYNRSNFCSHTVYSRKLGIQGVNFPLIRSFRLDPPHAGWSADSYWDYSSAYNAHVAAQPIAMAALGVSGLTKLQANWLSYADSGFAAVQPDLTKVSIPNFLIEIGQLRGLASDVRPLIDGTFGNASQLNAKIAAFKKLERGGKVRSVSKLIAEKRLSYKYGWVPTIGDLTDMLDGVMMLKARLDAFKESIGKTLSFTKTLEKTSISKSGTFNLGGDVHYKVEWWGALSGKVQYHAKYQPQPLAVTGPLDEKIRAFLDTFGFELNPQILWDEIPFSFVVDYFCRFGDWLSQFKVDALELPILMIDSSVDYHEEYQINSTVTVNPNGYPTDVSSTTKPAGYYEHRKYYNRMPVDPSTTAFRSLHWRNPTGSQWTNLVSLATVLGV